MARPRTPTQEKELKGTAQPCRLNPSEPKPKRGLPTCPDHLTDDHRAAWCELVAIMDSMNTATVWDGPAVEAASGALAELRRHRETLADIGHSYTSVTESGSEMRRANPEVAMLADADRRFGFWATKLGITPADRSRVSAAEEKPTDPWAVM